MKLKTIKISIEKVIAFYFMFVLIFSGYVEYTVVWNVLCLVCFMVMFMVYGRSEIVKSDAVVWEIIVLGILLVLNIINSEGKTYISANIRSLLYTLSLQLSFMYVCKRKPEVLLNLLVRGFWFLNALYVLNIIVLFRQIKGQHLFIKPSWLELNPFYPDLCAGTFGYNSTNILGMFVIFIMLYNFMYADHYIEQKHYKNMLKVYTVLTEVIVLYLSTQNDANAVFIFLPLAIILRILVRRSKDMNINLARYLKYLIGAVLILLIALNIPIIRDYFSDTVVSKLHSIFTSGRMVTKANGSSERLAIAYYGLTHSWGWLLGKGIGYAKWQSPYTFGFRHFGLSSIGSFINLTGIWFYMVSCLLMTSIIYRIAGCYSVAKAKVARYLCILISVIIMTIYTFVFTGIRTIILLFLITVVLFHSGERDKE